MHRSIQPAVIGLLAVTLCLTASAGAASADPGTTAADTSVVEQTDPGASLAEEASDTLAEVEELLAEDAGPVQPVEPLDVEEGPREATLVLRDLVLERSLLRGGEREAADGYLARPTDGRGAPYGATYSVPEADPVCDADICVHRVDSTSDRATADFAQLALDTVAQAHQTYTRAGYRAPKADGTRGGGPKTDIYLADIGDRGVYGYCTSDQPAAARVHSRWAYCVLDNDYNASQFPGQTPLDNLRVTAAHEYFHAVQFGYDLTEDVYFMEGTATWAEGQVFGDIDDNVQYLRFGSMRRPGRSLDRDYGGLEVYSTWGFFQYLSEKFDAASGGMPRLVRTMWRRADAAGSAPDRYSLQAVADAVRGQRSTLRREFAGYSVANRHPARVYDEAEANGYPVAQLAGRATLGRGASWSRQRRADHLTSHTFRLTPATGLTGRRWRLRVAVDLPPAGRGSEVAVSVHRRNGSLGTSRITLNRSGGKVFTRPFAAGTVRAVEVSLVNASTRIRRCHTGSAISCGGRARDDRQPFRISTRVVRR